MRAHIIQWALAGLHWHGDGPTPWEDADLQPPFSDTAVADAAGKGIDWYVFVVMGVATIASCTNADIAHPVL